MVTTKLIISLVVILSLQFLNVTPVTAQTKSTPLNQAINPNAKPWIPVQKMCTAAPKTEWLTKEEFLLLMKHRGYNVQAFRVIYESCYEVYGFDKNGRIIEAYFNPENAKINRQNNVNDR
jgi:hypothetical protein